MVSVALQDGCSEHKNVAHGGPRQSQTVTVGSMGSMGLGVAGREEMLKWNGDVASSCLALSSESVQKEGRNLRWRVVKKGDSWPLVSTHAWWRSAQVCHLYSCSSEASLSIFNRSLRCAAETTVDSGVLDFKPETLMP